MNYHIYDGIPILPSKAKPYVSVEQINGTVLCRGFACIRDRLIGLVSQRRFSSLVEAYAYLCNGAYVINTDKIIPSIVSTVCEYGPVVNIKLPPLTIERVDKRARFDNLDLAIRSRLSIQTMTEVSLDIYAALWKSIGASVSRI